jgi:hypothetical protein
MQSRFCGIVDPASLQRRLLYVTVLFERRIPYGDLTAWH